MASTLTVDNIVGATSSGSIHIPGHVVQVVEASTRVRVESTSTTLLDTGLEATITPSSTSSKIVILATTNAGKSATNTYAKFQFTRNGTSLGTLGDLLVYNNSAVWFATQVSFQQVDSPSTTSPVTYKLQFANEGGAGSVYVQIDSSSSVTNGFGQIILMEIAQ